MIEVWQKTCIFIVIALDRDALPDSAILYGLYTDYTLLVVTILSIQSAVLPSLWDILLLIVRPLQVYEPEVRPGKDTTAYGVAQCDRQKAFPQISSHREGRTEHHADRG